MKSIDNGISLHLCLTDLWQRLINFREQREHGVVTISSDMFLKDIESLYPSPTWRRFACITLSDSAGSPHLDDIHIQILSEEFADIKFSSALGWGSHMMQALIIEVEAYIKLVITCRNRDLIRGRAVIPDYEFANGLLGDNTHSVPSDATSYAEFDPVLVSLGDHVKTIVSSAETIKQSLTMPNI